LAEELRALLPAGSAAQRSVEERRGGSLAGAVAFSVPLVRPSRGAAAKKDQEQDQHQQQPGVGEKEARRLARRAVLRLRTATRVLELVGEADLDPRRAAGDTVYEAVRGFEEEGEDEDDEEEDGGRRRRGGRTMTTSAPLLRGGWASLLPGGRGGARSGGGRDDRRAPIGTLGVKAQLWANSNVSNSQLVAKRVRDACLDAVRERTGHRPAPPPPAPSAPSAASPSSSDSSSNTPDLPLFAHLTRDRLSLYRDWAGGSLHRRGYRRGAPVHKAALNESAAAALLAACGWWDPAGRGRGVADAVLSGDPASNSRRLALLDPMCGSATMLVEAALAAVRAAPGLLRLEAAAAEGGQRAATAHAFERWPDHEAKLWQEELEEARRERREGEEAWRAAAAAAFSAEAAATTTATTKRKKSAAAATAPPPPPPLLFGGDVDERALSLARHASRQAGVEDLIGFWHGPCAERDGKGLCEAAEAAVGGGADGPFLTAPPRLAVANPPWGVRLLPWEGAGGGDGDGGDDASYLFEEDDDRNAPAPPPPASAAQAEGAAQAAWDDLRVALKAAAATGGDPDATLSAWVLSGNDKLSLGLRSERKRVLLAGGRKLAWLSFLVRPARAAAAGGGGTGAVGGVGERQKPRVRSH
jgi:23S rRNA G2445 N2-methylase RlmL